jgi:hypothetical protein
MFGSFFRACAWGLVAAGALVGPQPACRAQWFQPPPAPEKILERLDAPTVMEFIETPLGDVVEYLHGTSRASRCGRHCGGRSPTWAWCTWSRGTTC